MQEVSLKAVLSHISSAIEKGDTRLAEDLVFPALDQFPDLPDLWHFAAIVMQRQGRTAVAVECWRKSYALQPNPMIWANIGTSLRVLQKPTLGREVMKQALDYDPTDQALLANIAGTYVNEGEPKEGIPYGERAILGANTEHAERAKFNLALLLLESGEYGRGFDLYAEGLHEHRDKNRDYGGGEKHLTPEAHQNRKGKPSLIVWGEQGIGDELLMATVLEDAKQDYRITFDCHPRLESLHKTASWAEGVTLVPTRKKEPKDLSADYKCPIGDLLRLYRRNGFPWNGPVIRGVEAETAQMRESLREIAGDRKIIGLAIKGGTMSTNRRYRSLQLQDVFPLLKDDRYLFVSLDYDDMTQVVSQLDSERFLWFPSVNWAWDYHHTASLIAATDAVVTVAQSVCHLSALMGHPTYALISSRPAWREGPIGADSGEQWFLYPHDHARLYRQEGIDWAPAVRSVITALEARFFKGEPCNPLPAHEQEILGEVSGSMCELGSKQFGNYKRYFEYHGIRHVSIDLNGAGGALTLDLQEPIIPESISGPFDVLTNFGTTEHVAEQGPCWKNVHNLIKPGGLLVSATPYPGDWKGHGHWYPTEDWYRAFCEQNGYAVEAMFVRDFPPGSTGRKVLCLRARKAHGVRFTFPLIPMFESEGGKVGKYT